MDDEEIQERKKLRILKRVHDNVLNALYKICREERTHAAVRYELVRHHLPVMNDEQIDKMRADFKDRETRFPDAMKAIRERLRIK